MRGRSLLLICLAVDMNLWYGQQLLCAAALPLQSALPYASTMSVISAVVYWYMSNAANNLTALEDNKTYRIQNEGIAHAQECYYGHIDS